MSEAARARRKHRNVVKMKFNLVNYLLETVSMVLTLAVRGYLVGLLQILVTSCGTPLIYYLGMDHTRQEGDVNIICINKCLSNSMFSVLIVMKESQGVCSGPCKDVQEEEQPGSSST